MEIAIKDLGLIEYHLCRTMQLECQQHVKEGGQELIYLCEHPDIYTMGKHAKAENLLSLPPGKECVRIERGGDITYHGPGQLVVYPVINLYHHHLGVKRYIEILEEAVIRTIAEFGIIGERVEGATGVWIGVGTPAERKICAIGVQVSRGVTMHGLALNVNTDLSAFSAINPCGFIDKGVTSIQAEIGSAVAIQRVKDILSQHLSTLLS